MTDQVQLENRAGHKCELCESTDILSFVALKDDKSVDSAVCVCELCKTQVESADYTDLNHWRCLNNSMWSEHSVVKVLSYRILHALKSESWASDLLEQIYLEEDEMVWAKEGIVENTSSVVIKDNNGAVLAEGDSVTLIKDLVVKGANFTAKRGTMVKGIRLSDNPLHIEGKVNGTKIVIISDFVKKV
jgi:protein PhnA